MVGTSGLRWDAVIAGVAHFLTAEHIALRHFGLTVRHHKLYNIFIAFAILHSIVSACREIKFQEYGNFFLCV